MDLPKPGDILFLSLNVLYGGPKDKFAIVGCVEPKPRLLLISSEVSALKRADPDQLNRQVVIDSARHAFLDYDSYVDCTDPLGADIGDIRDQLRTEPWRYKGRVEPDVLGRIREAVTDSPTIAPVQVRWLLSALE